MDIEQVRAVFIGRYSIVQQIGEGGQATVYEAHKLDAEENKSRVALKLHKPSAESSRVEREIDALQGFEHPCLAKFVEHGAVIIAGEELRFVAWHYVQGSPLNKLIERGALNPAVVASIGRDVARAIDHIWLKRIVHRDVNPKNIIVRDDGTGAVLIDLGVARYLNQTVLTAAGMTWGTKGYFSPEQWMGENLTCLSDVFALAVTLLEALSGKHPTAFDQNRLFNSPPRTCQIAPTCPVELAKLIDSSLSLRQAFRPVPSEITERLTQLAAILRPTHP